MSFMETVLSAYGLHKAKPAAAASPAQTGDACSKMDSIAVCNAKLIGIASENDAFHNDAQLFLTKHLDLLRRTRTDATSARFAMFRDTARLIPLWLWAIVLVVAVPICILLLLVVLPVMLRLITGENKVPLVKVLMLGGFTLSVLFLYAVLPI